MDGLRSYLGLFRGQLPTLGAAALLLSVAAMVPALAVAVLQRALEAVDTGGPLAALCLAFVGLYVLGAVLQLGRTALTKRLAWALTERLRIRVHRRFLDLSQHQVGEVGARLATLSSEVDELQYGVSALVTAFRNPLTLLALGVTATVMAPSLAAWALLVLPLTWVVTQIGGRRLRSLSGRWRDARSALTSLAQEQLQAVSLIRAFHAQHHEAERFSALAREERRARVRLEVERVLPGVATQIAMAFAVGGLLFAGGRQVALGALSPSQLVGFVVALGLMARPLSGLSEVWSLLQRSIEALRTVRHTLELEPALSSPSRPQSLPAGPLALRMEQVSVDYGAGEVVRDVDLALHAGAWLALVGPTGGGKTSLVRLLVRQRDPTSGHVWLGDVEPKQVEGGELARRVAYVPQESFLFARTVRDNLCLGRRGLSDVALEQALHVAQAGFAHQLPQGLDTVLRHGGRELSGGQRQRLAVARALLSNPSLLVLDEATNQVDVETEDALLTALKALPQGPTVVLVAHNLAVAQRCDRVAVVGDGGVVEFGTPAELLAQRGAYWRLCAPANAP